jgi:hypothetical protein
MCSIHQPSYKIFASFSKICFLVKGRLVYSGGFPEVMPYFAARGFEVPTFDSPADFYMRVMQTEGPMLIEAWKKAAPVIERPPPEAAAAAAAAGAGAAGGGEVGCLCLGVIIAAAVGAAAVVAWRAVVRMVMGINPPSLLGTRRGRG